MSGIALSLQDIKIEDRPRVGGKGFALSILTRGGLRVPPALCITPEAYLEFISATGVRETILLELGRKAFEDMRWEEIWDTSLRIRNAFLNSPLSAKPPGEIGRPSRGDVLREGRGRPLFRAGRGFGQDLLCRPP